VDDRVTLRPLRLPDDLPALVEVANLAFAAEGVERRASEKVMAAWFGHPDDQFDAARDVVLAEADGAVLAYAVGGWEEDNDGGRNYAISCQVRPDWRRRGIGSALQERMESHQRGLAAGHPPDLLKRMDVWADAREASKVALLERFGYAAVRWWAQMDRPLSDLPAAVLPDGLEFRPAREELLRRYWETDVEVFRDHWGGVDDTETALAELRDDPRRDISLWAIVHEGDEIVALASNRIDHAENELLGVQRGWINGVAVRRAWRRRGVGSAVVAESMRLLAGAGMQVGRLGVDTGNQHGAMAIYERLGFSQVAGGAVYRKPLEMDR
jgi:mycothiol synthase